MQNMSWRWDSVVLIDVKSTLSQVIAWCPQATNHYLTQCWQNLWHHMVTPGLNEWITVDHFFHKVELQYTFFHIYGVPCNQVEILHLHVFWCCAYSSRRARRIWYKKIVNKGKIWVCLVIKESLYHTIQCRSIYESVTLFIDGLLQNCSIQHWIQCILQSCSKPSVSCSWILSMHWH